MSREAQERLAYKKVCGVTLAAMRERGSKKAGGGFTAAKRLVAEYSAVAKDAREKVLPTVVIDGDWELFFEGCWTAAWNARRSEKSKAKRREEEGEYVFVCRVGHWK